MGEEIDQRFFDEADFSAFQQRLEEETALLRTWFHNGDFGDAPLVAGLELEAWLVDDNMLPAPRNDEFLAALNDPLVVHELARFNVEINTPPVALHGDALSRIHANLGRTRRRCERVASELGLRLLTIGILPTLRDAHLCQQNMSSLQRYHALNEQILAARSGQPLQLNIHGREHTAASHNDVMLESGTTSTQIHLQVPAAQANRYYNSAKILSAPMVAVTANAPYLFGRDLWDETRIPLFEQAVATPGRHGRLSPERVSFGERYVYSSLMECFDANLSKYPVLLPRVQDEAVDSLSHLRLHNGTIWRWNRPLVGTEESARHLRIEHRVTSGPTSDADTVANMALYFGLARAMAEMEPPPEQLIDFSHAQRNFYAAARHGLLADVLWLKKRTVPVYVLLQDELLPLAREGLHKLGLDTADIDMYLAIIAARVAQRHNGAHWQRAFVRRHGRDMAALTAAYLEQQRGGEPVHSWPC